MSIRGLTILEGDFDEGCAQTGGAWIRTESARHAAKISLSQELPAISVRASLILLFRHRLKLLGYFSVKDLRRRRLI
jgi:hypothetical protein